MALFIFASELAFLFWPNFSNRAIGIINFEKTFSKFYRRHYELISKYNVGLKMLLNMSLSKTEFYGDLVYKFKKVQVAKDQEKAQSEKDSHSKNRGGKKPNQQSGTHTMKIFRKPNEQLFSQ